MSRDYAFSLLGSIEPEPLIVIANSSDGPWVSELTPSRLPDPPIEFFSVREGTFGPILNPTGLVLMRNDFLSALREFTVEGYVEYPATIRPPQSDETIHDYSVVKISRVTPLTSISVSAGQPTLSVVKEVPDAVLVSDELRVLLEQLELPGLAFSEPLFEGSASAG